MSFKKTRVLVVALLAVGMTLLIGWFPASLGSMEKSVANGDRIVAALEQYFEQEKAYPETLGELVPKYIDKIPFSGAESERAFSYYKIEDDDISVDEYYYGFQLSLAVGKFSILGGRSAKRLIYSPAERYPLRKWEKPKKLIGTWAYVVIYRRYGAHTNPMILKNGEPVFLEQ